MGFVTVALRFLGLDRGRWARLIETSLWPAIAVVATASLERTFAVVAAPYGIWLAVLGLHLLEKVQHLL